MPELSEFFTINSQGELVETVDFGPEIVEYEIIGVTEHIIFGVFFTLKGNQYEK